MTNSEVPVMGLFINEEKAATAITELKASPWPVNKVYGPVPGHKVFNALNHKKSPLGWFTLVGGIIGFFSGFILAAFTAGQWNLIVSGKPIVALVPFFIVGFEFTILFAVFGNIIGLITLAGLPNYKEDPTYDPRCSGHHFGVLSACGADEQKELEGFFKSHGGEVRVFDRI